jgi:SAM-dependent methyltransferase
MNTFSAYAKYYNLFYQDKDYQSEVDYIHSMLGLYSGVNTKSILDIGCGTGSHDVLLANKGYQITGIDRSREMIEIGRAEIADRKDVEYYVFDATEFDLKKQFDAVLALFHVASYQKSNQALLKLFANAYRHLRSTGIFLFDFWYGPAVLTEKPSVRLKEVAHGHENIYRIASPCINVNENSVDVYYKVLIDDKYENKVTKIEETHKMRYFFLPELEFMLSQIGFEVIKALEWMTHDKPLNSTTWNGVLVVRK